MFATTTLLALVLACGEEELPVDSATQTDTDTDTDADSDADSDADTDSDTDVVENTAPSMPGVVGDPDPPIAGNPLSCVIETESVDAEGDEVSYSWTFYLDNEVVEDGVIAEVGQAFTCKATPSDGELEGEPHTRGYVVENPCVSLEDGYGTLEDSDGAFDLGTDSTAELTVEAWIKPDEYEGVLPLIWKQAEGNTSSSRVDWGVMLNREHQLIWATGLSEDPCAYMTSHPGLIEPGEWTHVALTYAASGPREGEKAMFVNGELVESCGYYLKNDASDGDIQLGVAAGGYSWHGLIDEVRVTAGVVYPNTGDFTPSAWLEADSDTLALWHVHNLQGDWLYDSSGKGRDIEVRDGTTTDSDGVCD